MARGGIHMRELGPINVEDIVQYSILVFTYNLCVLSAILKATLVGNSVATHSEFGEFSMCISTWS